ncbi:MAG TPA: DUF4350 domain-containing protein, partial [Cellvibrio sp.]|nr:DUF4350 domain-containing protein [Cellvibrio sp.]
MTASPNTTKKLSVRQRWLLLGTIVLALLCAGYWWYTGLIWEEKEIDLGYSKEAKQNDFLAAEIFLRKHGVQATTVKNLSLLDNHSWRNIKLGAQDTIVIINGYKTLTQERYDSLYEWIENGGTLITSTQNPFIGTHTEEEDLLLNDFGIELTPEEKESDTRDPFEKLADELEDAVEGNSGEDEDEPEQTPAPEATAAEPAADSTTENKKNSAEQKSKKDQTERSKDYYRCSLKEAPTEIDFAGDDKPLRFDFSNTRPFIYYNYAAPADEAPSPTDDSETPNSESATAEQEENSTADANAEEAIAKSNGTEEKQHHVDERREHLASFDVGEGSVTVTSDNYIWTNQRVDCHDHAYGLWQLVNPKGRVWFLVNQDAPSLAALLWRHASYGVLAALIALALWLWAKSLRFGPVLAIEQTGRRSLAEHIYASAMLLWRKQEHPQLLQLLRREILDRINEQHPNLSQAAQSSQVEFLQEL